jgi:hypothetical protein
MTINSDKLVRGVMKVDQDLLRQQKTRASFFWSRDLSPLVIGSISTLAH